MVFIQHYETALAVFGSKGMYGILQTFDCTIFVIRGLYRNDSCLGFYSCCNHIEQS